VGDAVTVRILAENRESARQYVKQIDLCFRVQEVDGDRVRGVVCENPPRAFVLATTAHAGMEMTFDVGLVWEIFEPPIRTARQK
jgi:hypothetical protein